MPWDPGQGRSGPSMSDWQNLDYWNQQNAYMDYLRQQIQIGQAINAPSVAANQSLAGALAGLAGALGRGGGGGGGPSRADQSALNDLKLQEALLRAAQNNGQADFINRGRGLDQRQIAQALTYIGQEKGFAGQQKTIDLGANQAKSDQSRNSYLQQLDQYNSDAVASGAYGAAGRNRTRGFMSTDQNLAQSLLNYEKQGIGLDYDKSMAGYANDAVNAQLGYEKSTLGHDQDAYNTFTQGRILGNQAQQQQQQNKMSLVGLK